MAEHPRSPGRVPPRGGRGAALAVLGALALGALVWWSIPRGDPGSGAGRANAPASHGGAFVDVAAERALGRGAEVVFIDNRARTLEGEKEIPDLLLDTARLAVDRAST